VVSRQSCDSSTENIEKNLNKVDITQTTQLLFDTARPESFQENCSVEVSFGSLPPGGYYAENAIEKNVHLSPEIPPLQDTALEDITSTEAPISTDSIDYSESCHDVQDSSKSCRDVQDSSESCLDVLTIADFKRILEDFTFNFSLAPPSTSVDENPR